jgi:hypothetical protein
VKAVHTVALVMLERFTHDIPSLRSGFFRPSTLNLASSIEPSMREDSAIYRRDPLAHVAKPAMLALT